MSLLRYLWPRCGCIGRKGTACTKAWMHSGRHRFPSKIETQLRASIEKVKNG